MILCHRTIRFHAPLRAIELLESPDAEFLRRQQAALEAAREEGYRAGYEEAQNFLNPQILEQRTQLAHLQQQTFQAVTATHAHLVEELEKALPVLSLEICRRVLGGVTLDEEIIRSVTSETLSELAPGTPDVELRLCPSDMSIVEGLAAEYQHIYPGLRLFPDAGLQPGDCVARSAFGTIDGSIDRKLENLSEALT
jgi:flagellar assembly protein FliH